MTEAKDASPFLPQRKSLKALRSAVDSCRGCGLHERATQAVFGAGLVRSRLMLVGEQPGDREDREGEPFVGPAGAVLDGALATAGIDRKDAYVTNAVKHFKWKPAPRGKRRIHDKPSRSEIKACEPWLRSELEVVGPDLIVCLGASAAQAVIGPGVRITRDHGVFFEPDELRLRLPRPAETTATLHPSAILRARDAAERERLRAELVADLGAVAERLA